MEGRSWCQGWSKIVSTGGESATVSTYFPHSNCHAKLAVKTRKRMLRDNLSAQCKLNTDKIMRARMQYTTTRQSRASGGARHRWRSIASLDISYKYKPSQEWVMMREDRTVMGMAPGLKDIPRRRRSSQWARLNTALGCMTWARSVSWS